MQPNLSLAKQRAGGTTIGPMLVYGSADLVEQVAHMGFDWIWLDWQHGQFTEHTLNNALARFLGVGTAPIVRVKGNEPGTINRVLDMGAMGVIVPMIQNATEAAAAVRATYYPPKGMRSAGGVRLGLIGDTFQQYCAEANEQIMLALMVETEEAIANVREIMAVPGVDVVLIGPGDLMIDVRAHGHDEAHHEELALEVAAASKETGVAAGYVCPTVEIAERRLAQGYRFINYGLDHFVMMDGFGEIRGRAKRWAGA